ncbi:LOW QUALITY PROTEIN: uncharacterized protein LOC116936069 [Daphnia magna]|uniref:LOW QUALITY PROTEIN: uncharacterized protein LOC116936069 n=1 Tax=Daphnia magna TaxID=35525 RepID=UPI001E1BC71E|nr:LOW QUALITY PROTEIN: uncharacterized protein LOC116936069 [Daphnia magna]
MMKHSFVAVFSVLTCIVYGQLPGNRPSVAQSNAAKFSVDRLHYTDEQPQLQNQFVVAKIEFLEMTVADLALELRSSRIITDFFIKKQRETNRKVIYLANKLATMEKMENEWAEAKSSLTAVQADLQKTKESLGQTLNELAETKSSLEIVKTDLLGTAETLTQTRNELAEKQLLIEAVKTHLEDFSTDAMAKLLALEGKIDGIATTSSTAEVSTNIGRLPGSCEDLKLIGYTKSGLYSVMGSKQVQTVYCDFTTPAAGAPVFQKLIGYQDVKSNPVYFYVQKTSDYSATFVPIPFERTIINIGGAMDAASGRFTAPVRGTYFFSFTGLAQFSASNSPLRELNVLIYRNGQAVARSQLNEVNGIANPYYLSPLTVQSTLTLQAGDKVWLQSDIVNGGHM